MDYLSRLASRIDLDVIRQICSETSGSAASRRRDELFALTSFPDDRVAYNALWILTHFSVADLSYILPLRDALIDKLLISCHIGRIRLTLSILQRLTDAHLDENASPRTDYLDFCFSNINSALPYGVRALCMKQAFAICRKYPDLLSEFMIYIDMLDTCGNLSRGLATARRNILKQISQMRRNV